MINQVERDGVVKEQIRSERISRNMWNSKWGFMTEEFQISLQYASTLGMSESKYREKISLRKFKPDQNKIEMLPDTVPIQSSGFIGWKVKAGGLEKYGPLYVNSKLGINCPSIEQLPITQVTIL